MGHSSKSDPDHNNPLELYAGLLAMYRLWDQAKRIDTTKTIKYAAGISVMGLRYYRDSRLDPVIVIGGKDVPYDFYWWVHETTEQRFIRSEGERMKTIMAEMGMMDAPQLHYHVAHQVAQELEYALIREAKIDEDAYTEACDRFIAYCAKRPLEASPFDLDLYPYEDEEDMPVMTEIRDTGGPESYMLLPVGQHGGEDGKPFWE